MGKQDVLRGSIKPDRRSRGLRLSSFVVAAALLLVCLLPSSVEGNLVDDAVFRNQITEWNDMATTEFAYLHLAQLDVLKAIKERRSDVNPTAAVAYASHFVIRTFHWEKQLPLDALVQIQLAPLNLSADERERAREFGTRMALPWLYKRLGGSSTLLYYMRTPLPESGGPPGVYRFCPNQTVVDWGWDNGGNPPLFSDKTTYKGIVPLHPAVTSPEFNLAVRETARIGSTNASLRTPAQNALRAFIRAMGLEVHRWYIIAKKVLPKHTSDYDTAYLFAAIAVSLQDGELQLYDDKYGYFFWRPVTAIRQGDSQNPAIPDWTPSVPTAIEPEYPSGAAFRASAALKPIMEFLGTDRKVFTLTARTADTNLTLTRTYQSFSDLVHESGEYRILAGNHFRFSINQGFRLGYAVAQDIVSKLRSLYK